MVRVEETAKALADAVKKSGLGFDEIPMDQYLKFIEQAGLKEHGNAVLNMTRDMLNAKKNGKHNQNNSVAIGAQSGSAGYSGNPLPEEKKREPRKNVFGKIEKIAG
jgi:hypothetical protein